jgi:hypothetical protein
MSCFAVARTATEFIDLTQLTLVDSARKGGAKNGGKKAQQDQANKKSPKSDSSTAAPKNQ